MWKAIPVLLLIFAGTLFALALRFVSDALSRWTRIPALLSLTLVLVVTLASIAVGFVMAAPSLIEQFRDLGEGLEESLIEFEEWVRDSTTGQLMVGWVEGLGENGEEESDIWGQVAGVFTTTFAAVAGFFLTLIIGIFLAYNPRMYVSGFLRLIPMDCRRRAGEILECLGETLRWWMVGQLISMLVLAVSTWLMLWILGVPLAFILGLLTGLLTFIPYLGPLIALVPIMLIAFVESPALAVYVLAFYLVIQNLESNVLMPIIFQKTVHLPPVLTIIAQILLGAIFGFVGIVLATPLMAAGIVLVKMIYVQDVLGDSGEEPVREVPTPEPTPRRAVHGDGKPKKK